MGRRKMFEKKDEEVKENEMEKELEVNEEIKNEESEMVPEEVVEEVVNEPVVEKETKNGKLVNCELLNARKEPSKDSEIVFVINTKDFIKVLEEVDDFYKVEVNNKIAYCMKKFIVIE